MVPLGLAIALSPVTVIPAVPVLQAPRRRTSRPRGGGRVGLAVVLVVLGVMILHNGVHDL